MQVLYRPQGSVPFLVWIFTSELQNLWRLAATYVIHAVKLRMEEYKGRKLARMIGDRPAGHLSHNVEPRTLLWRLGCGRAIEGGIGVVSRQRLTTSGFPTKILYTFIFSLVSAICPTYVIALDLIIRIHTYTCIRTYVRTYIHTYIHTYIRGHTYIHTYIHTYVYTYIHTYVHTYVYTYIHTNIRIYIHT